MTAFLGDRRENLYIVRGQPMTGQSGWILDSEEEQEVNRTEGSTRVSVIS